MIAKLVKITPTSLWYGRYNELVFMWFRNQRSHHWGAPHCSNKRYWLGFPNAHSLNGSALPQTVFFQKIMMDMLLLVGGIPTPLKNMKVS